ncbi:MAG: GSCFA domain-containing protein [Bacteroidaceae bacterium]|nr:GSCFA domain-containing protein [Bacteroidaceae bacterium]
MKVGDNAFRTIVDVPKWANPMRPQHRFVLLGSCFAQNIGEQFQSYGLDAVCNPLGVIYNPESIAVQVKESLSLFKGEDTLPESTLFSLPLEGSGEAVWRCWWAGTLINDTDEERFRETIHKTFSHLGEALREADFLFITLGTNVCYRLKENGMIVTNCHKIPATNFEEVTLDLETCTDILSGTMDLLTKECPKLQVVFTVSPYRYKKYGFHGSQLAKATLLLTVDELCRRYPEKASYFPAYEMVMDDLRDYRFYAEDMIHPSPVAVNYIWHRMVENCMDGEMQKYLEDYEPIRKAKRHRALSLKP